MLFVLGAALALSAAMQAGQNPRRDKPSVVRDSTMADSTKYRAPRRLPVTADDQRTAFHDERARELLLHARVARLAQDSSLRSYDSRVRERLTARFAIGSHGPERIMYRQENAYRVQWQEGLGARVEMTGARVGIPMAPPDAQREALEQSLIDGGMTSVPYAPGQDAMGIGIGPAKAEVDDRTIVQPLAVGAEAYYTYATGDSMSWTLPDGKRVRLRELEIRPRTPQWNLAVGSLWFDVESGQLVRAAYRLAVPIDLWARVKERQKELRTGLDYPWWAKAIVSPLKFEVSAIAIEYGLFDGRYWLPRTRSFQGIQQVSFAHIPIALEQAFSYDKINGPISVAAIALNAPDIGPLDEVPDSLSGDAAEKWRDSVWLKRLRTRHTFSDSLHKAACDSTGQRVLARKRQEMSVAVTYPCDLDKLAKSAEFETSLYDPNEQVFGTKERDALINDALPLGAQALIRLGALPRPSFQYGLSMTRYNRIEGFSTGILTEQQLGAGYSASLTTRIGFADREPNVELSLARSSSAKSVSLTGYNRLVSASDWGNPLSFGSSVSALLFGRDEGFYYRASGAELAWSSQRFASLDWRLFGEQQRTAVQRTNYSFGPEFMPNIVAATGASFGGGVRWLRSTGDDPRGFRTLSDIRVEAAGGDSSYGRAAGDLTLSTGLPMKLAAALTLAGGASVGQLPAQRRWFLGGAQTIRGESPDTAQSGNAFWMSRLELAHDRSAYRLIVFGDLGWAGDRSKISDLVRPMSSAGVGLSMMDGLIRFDVARGFYPRQQTRISAYLNARF